MPSIFSRIIAGELPGKFVWKDERAVAFMSIAPMMPGPHPRRARAEIDHWIDLEPALAAHLFAVAQQIGRAQDLEWKPRRIGLLIVGEEVPHTHLHVVPINHPEELTFAHADPSPDFDALDDAAAPARSALASSARPRCRTRRTAPVRPDCQTARQNGSSDRSRDGKRTRATCRPVADESAEAVRRRPAAVARRSRGARARSWRCEWVR